VLEPKSRPKTGNPAIVDVAESVEKEERAEV
jgi:hypothetical protein